MAYVSNECADRYLLEVQSTSGFVAFRLAEGEIIVSRSQVISIRPTLFLSFWSCRDFQDTSSAGEIFFLDCHGSEIGNLDVSALRDLEYLDASFNRLKTLSVQTLTRLKFLNIEHNNIRSVDLRGLNQLREIKTEGNNGITVQRD